MRKIILKRNNRSNPQIKSYTRAVKEGLKSQHVLKVDNGWAVKRAGSSRVSKFFDSQKKAVSYGKRAARKNNTDLFVHRKNGRIRERISY